MRTESMHATLQVGLQHPLSRHGNNPTMWNGGWVLYEVALVNFTGCTPTYTLHVVHMPFSVGAGRRAVCMASCVPVLSSPAPQMISTCSIACAIFGYTATSLHTEV